MVRRILNLLNWEISGLHEAAFLLGLSAFSSQILALFRDRLLAGTFGAGRELDIYYASFRIPDLLFISVGSFLAVTVIIPLLISKIEESEKDGIEKARMFLSEIMTVFSFVMVVFCLVIYFSLPYISEWIVPGFDIESKNIMVEMSRILLLSPFFLGLSNLLGSVTQSFRKFFVYALSPVFYNIGIISGILFFYPNYGLKGLAYGVAFGAFMHFAIQLPVVLKIGMFPFFTSNINWKELKSVFLLSLPRTLALGSNQLAVMFLLALGSFMKPGSISIFNFSYNLQSVPLAIIGVSYSVAALPEMSRIFSRKKIEEFVSYVENALSHILFWSVPVTVLFLVLRAQIVRTILGSGRFDWNDTRLTIAALAIFSFSVIAQNLIQLLDRVYYATGNTRKPVITKIISSLIIMITGQIMVLSYNSSEIFKNALEFIFRVEGVNGTEILMLPLAFSLGTLFNLFALYLLFSYDFNSASHKINKTLVHSSIASVALGIVSYILLKTMPLFFVINTLPLIFLQGLLAGIGGIITAFFVLKLFKSRELFEISRSFKQKFWKTETIIPGPEEADIQ